MNIKIEDPVAHAITEMSPNRLSTKDVYFRLCACLDREIELVWKRAVFLTAFLIACFAGYGGLIATYLGIDKPRQGTFAVISIAAIGIAFIGMALSVIWIMMAKGSKAWQEHYEKVIECFVKTTTKEAAGNTPKTKDDSILAVFASGNPLETINGCALKSLGEDNLTKKRISGGLFTNCGGPYSVSKIVIVLGRMFLFCWSVVATIHSLYLVFHQDQLHRGLVRFLGMSPSWLDDMFKWLVVISPILLLGMFIMSVIVRFWKKYRPHGCVSSYLRSLEQDKEIPIKEDNNG